MAIAKNLNTNTKPRIIDYHNYTLIKILILDEAIGKGIN